MKRLEADIVVVGAGLVGLSAATALTPLHKKVVLVDAHAVPEHSKPLAWDKRIYAITPSNRAWLNELGVWQYLDASRVCNIDKMHLWEPHSNVPLQLTVTDANMAALGVILESHNLMTALWQRVNALKLPVISQARCVDIKSDELYATLTLDNETQILAKLVIAADGVNSWLREQAGILVERKTFDQIAIVANFMTEKPHQNVARQWFAPHETLALLPLVGRNVSLVWSVSTKRAQELLSLTHDAFVNALGKQSDNVLGKLALLGDLHTFELNQQTARSQIANRLVFIGDAAHQVHPMAGQGVNLGFRDVRELQRLLTNAYQMQDIGEHAFLRRFERARKLDVAKLTTLTSGLDFLFASEQKILQKMAHWGMMRLNEHSELKRMLIEQAVI